MINPFLDFWEESSLTKYNIREYGSKMSGFDADNKELKLSYPNKPTIFKNKKTKLSRLTASRKSVRAFESSYLSLNQIMQILSQLSAKDKDLEHRSYPSAGASYCVETFVLSFGEKQSDNKVLYYDAQHNGIQEIADHNLNKKSIEKLCNINYSGTLSALILFVGLPDRITIKYSSRGYRFMLIEAGSMLQQIALGTAQSKKVSGCPVGGLLDDEILKILNLDQDKALLITGCIIGTSLKKS